MGRTVATYRMIMEQIIAGWDKFRKALSGKDRDAFDSMMTKARSHAAASGYELRTDPTEAVFMSILLEHEKEIEELKGEGEEEADERLAV